MLPWSVMPIAGWPSAAAAATTSSIRAAPSSIEYSVCTWRWVKLNRATWRVSSSARSTAGVHSNPQALSTSLWMNDTAVISTVAVPPPRTAPIDGGRSRPAPRGRCRARRRQGRSPARRRPDRPGPGPGRAGRASARAAGARRHLLGEQRGLDAVEQALEPADELGLGDPQLGVGGRCRRRRAGEPPSSSCRSGDRASAELARPRSRRSRAAARGPARRARPARTSSSSCLIIEPIRMTLAGCSTDSRRRRPSPSGAGRRRQLAVGHGSTARRSGRLGRRGHVGHAISSSRRQRPDAAAGRASRPAVSDPCRPTSRNGPGVGGIVERDGVAGDEGDVAQPAARRRR